MSISPSGHFGVWRLDAAFVFTCLILPFVPNFPNPKRRQAAALQRRKAWDSNPHAPCGARGLANRSGQPYPGTLHFWSAVTCHRFLFPHRANPSHARSRYPKRRRVAALQSGPPGSRTPISWLQARCRPVGPAAHFNDPGWSRTIVSWV